MSMAKPLTKLPKYVIIVANIVIWGKNQKAYSRYWRRKKLYS